MENYGLVAPTPEEQELNNSLLGRLGRGLSGIVNDPRKMAMLGGLGQGLLQAGAVSQRPISWAEAMAMGMQGANQMTQQYDNMARQQRLDDMAQQRLDRPGADPATTVQSTYVNAAGKRVAIMRDGSQMILGDAGANMRLVDGMSYDPVRGTFVDPAVGVTEDGPRAPLTPNEVRTRQDQETQRLAQADALRAEEVEKARQRAASFADMNKNEGILRSLDEMERLVQEGIYTGGAIDRLGRLSAGVGLPWDEGKASRTVQLRQMTTQLKLMAKPPGMGAMSDAEWKMLQQAIPDPDTGTTEQLMAGIAAFRREINSRMGQTSAPSGAVNWSDL